MKAVLSQGTSLNAKVVRGGGGAAMVVTVQ